ncbi:MAG TPA: GNAT family N-acetyltransferase [Streptosporangiaceae bacterium]|nr:GNAT family N-acetyltransferase [Streptosporangiaceae bacterium]
MTDERGLRLRPPGPGDEAEFRAAHRVMAASDGFTFGLGLRPGMAWSAYLKLLDDERAGIGLAVDRVPATFLVADVSREIVGRTSIRHALTDYLRQKGGHIGYGVLPAHRRRGYATEILRQSLVIARSVGIDRVLVTCDDDNAGSAAAIEACGGKLDSLVENGPGEPPIRRYWID